MGFVAGEANHVEMGVFVWGRARVQRVTVETVADREGCDGSNSKRDNDAPSDSNGRCGSVMLPRPLSKAILV